MQATPRLEKIESALDEPIFGFIDRLRKDDRSWAYIARTIFTATQIEVSDEFLRRWYLAAVEAAEASTS